MVRKALDPTLIASLVDGAATQVVGGGSPKTDDPNFPVFRTPLNTDLIIYMPRTPVVNVDGQDVYNPLTSHVHNVRKGAKMYLQYRCVTSLSGGVYDELGYDGTCPFCDGMADCWDLYNKKIEMKAREQNIDPSNDPDDLMKPWRQQYVQDMAIKKADEFVTFPIVIISETGTVPRSLEDAKMQAQFVMMRKETFVEKIMDVLTKQPVPITNPAGYYFKWAFTYDTKGKPANVRDAARKAQYIPILDVGSTQLLTQFTEKAEEVAKEFTNVKAATVVLANQFYSMEFLRSEAISVLTETRKMLQVLENTPVGATPAITANTGVANALASFGVANTAPAGAIAMSQSAPAPTPAAVSGQPMAQQAVVVPPTVAAQPNAAQPNAPAAQQTVATAPTQQPTTPTQQATAGAAAQTAPTTFSGFGV